MANPAAAAVVVASVHEMMEQDAGGGFESADRDAYAVPFISILQSGSPQVKRSDGAYIKGAEEGMFYNSVTQEVQSGEEVVSEGDRKGKPGGLLVVPCYYKRSFTRWAPRDSGGGLRGEYSPSDPILTQCRGEGGSEVGFGGRLLPDKEGKFHPKSSDMLNDTRTHYVLVLRDKEGKFATTLEDVDGFSPAVISVTSTQIRKSRLWMSKMNDLKLKRQDGTLFTPPMFSHVYALTTVPEQNDQGSWYGWRIETLEQLARVDIYSAARDFRNAIKAGEVKTAAITEDAIGGGQPRGTNNGRGADSAKTGDDNIPF